MVRVYGEKFITLLNVLKKSSDIPRKLQVQAFLETIQLDQLPYNVFADKWPEWEIVIAKPKEELSLKIPVYKLGIYCKTQRWKNLRDMLCNTGFLPPERTIWIYGLPMEHVPAIEATAAFLNHNASFISLDEPRYCMEFPVVNPSELDVDKLIQHVQKPLVKNFYLSNLDAKKHIDIIIKSWKTHNFHDFFITDDEGREVIKYILSFKHMNFGIFRKSDNDLATWYLSDINGSGLMGHTLPQYRKSFLIGWIVTKAFEHNWKMNKIYFGYMGESRLQLSGDQVFTMNEVPCVHGVMRPKKTVMSSLL